MQEFIVLMKSELGITLIIFYFLLMKLKGTEVSNGTMLIHANAVLLLNFLFGFFLNQDGTLFGDMFYTNHTIAFEKNLINFGTLIISMQAYDWLKNHKHVAEFYMLLLSCVLGMFFMISSGNFLIFYLGLELATIPLAALCNFDLEKRVSSEAAMKMIMSSAFSSAILLFGISMMYGATGTISFAELPGLLDGSGLQTMAFVMLFSGFAFKLSVVPFHLWTADVYEGSPVAVTSFLSVISKGSIVFVFISTLYKAFEPMSEVWYNILFIAAIITMTVGNLFALRQNNMKRFLAFSSITQVGFILIGISGSSQAGMTSALFFILVYIFSNLGAFGVVNYISSLTGKENIDDYKALYKTNPLLTWCLALSLFSLAGIPPTAGFFGKLFLLTAGAAKGNYVLIIIAALNMVVALYYYLRVIRSMFMDANENPIEALSGSMLSKFALIICVVGLLLTGIFSGAYDYIYSLSFGL